jgi:hypothetical protein
MAASIIARWWCHQSFTTFRSSDAMSAMAVPEFCHIPRAPTHVWREDSVKTDGTVTCWGDNYYGQATPP